MNSAPPTCPCDLSIAKGATFAQCCEPLLLGAQCAATATQLMRSRYSAFATNAFDYLVQTHHPSQRASDERAQLEAQSTTLQWVALQVCDSRDGNPDQQQGEVEFKAYFRSNSTIRCLHERSRFVREDGQWFYMDAVFGQELRVDCGRNDACFCGSGRKFKQCHGRA